ncbi:hypothetical protein ACVINW_001043 [Bradyrhizobium sp. USDA 4461]
MSGRRSSEHGRFGPVRREGDRRLRMQPEMARRSDACSPGRFSASLSLTVVFGKLRLLGLRAVAGGTMAMKRITLLAVWLAVVASVTAARAQSGDVLRPEDGLPVDEHIARELQEHRGVVIVDAILMMSNIGGGLTRCVFPVVTLGQTLDKSAPTKTIRVSVIGGGKLTAFGGITSLPPGEYLLLSIRCDNINAGYGGPHAKFQVRAGEIVDIGALRLDHEGGGLFSNAGKMHRSVGDISPEVVAFLKARAPRAMTHMVRRPMTMIGPPDSVTRTSIRRCGIIGCF